MPDGRAALVRGGVPAPEDRPADTPGAAENLPGGSGDEPPPPVIVVHNDFAPDDYRTVVGVSENVFVATVDRLAGREVLRGSIPDESLPQTQYAVTVERSVKASGPRPLRAGDRAIVNQLGGVDAEDGRSYAVETLFGDQHYPDELVEPGRRYVFATEYRPDEDWHAIVVQPTGNLRLGDGPWAEDGRVALYETAAQDPTPPPGLDQAPGGTFGP